MDKKVLSAAVISIIATILVAYPLGIRSGVLAEQSGDTPESGVTSYIKQVYDSLVSLGHGSDGAGAWGDWGEMWNRIQSAGEWEPDGTAGAEDVAAGETFYGDSRTEETGTAQLAQEFELQALVEWDDYEDPDDQGEESEWTNTATNVWRDERTGLYWSNSFGTSTNVFPDQDHSPCPFFDGVTEMERLAARYGYDGLDADCGDAINTCGSLELDADGDGNDDTNWYLPSQKELWQAYMDGMYNHAGAAFTGSGYFTSSSEVSGNSANMWNVMLTYGYVNPGGKTTTYGAVRCVARD